MATFPLLDLHGSVVVALHLDTAALSWVNDPVLTPLQL